MMFPILADFGIISSLIVSLIISAISTGVMYLLRPKPSSGLKPTKFGEFEVPTHEQGTPCAVILGTPARSSGYELLWYGDYSTQKVESEDVVINYKYYCGAHLGLSLGNLDGILQIWSDVCLWPTLNDPTVYAADGETSILIVANTIWGGKKRGGGLYGQIDVLYGGSDQAVNTYLAAQLPTPLPVGDLPAFRGVATLVFEKFYWGTAPRMAVLAFVPKRINKLHDGTSQWYLAKAVINIYELNIVHAIREAMTSGVWGSGLDTALIDATTFEAAADTLYAEGMGISYRYMRDQENVKAFIRVLEEIGDLVVYFDDEAGLYKIKLIREDYDPDDSGALTTYTENDFEITQFARPSPIDTPCRTIVWYTDRASAQRAPAFDDDPALLERQGGTPITQEFEWPMIHDPDLANTLVAREQRQASAMPAGLSLSCERTMHDLRRGDVFRITHPRLLAEGVEAMIVRVVQVSRGRLEDGALTIQVVEDIFSGATAVYTSPPDTDWIDPTEDTTNPSDTTLTNAANAATGQLLNEIVS